MDKLIEEYQVEIEVLGRILKDPDLFYAVDDQIKYEDFMVLKHKVIFEGMRACTKSGIPIEIGTIFEKLKGSDISISHLLEISNSVASTSDIKHYTNIINEKSNKRQMKLLLENTLKLLNAESFEALVHRLHQKLYLLSEEKTSSKCVDRPELMEKTLNYLQEGIDSKGESIGMKTGWNSLDIPLTGFKKGDLTIIAARPSVGKTVFSLNLANNLSDKYKTLFFELEMQDTKLGLRQISAMARIPLNRLYAPHKLEQNEISRITNAIEILSRKGNMIIDDLPRATLEHIKNRIHYIKKTQGLDVVFIDHIGLIPMPDKIKNRNDWLGEVCSMLKSIAKEFDISIVGLSQVNRGLEYRADKRPMLSDLRDSGNIEQDADVVLLLYRDGYYNKEDAPENENLEIIIAKNRDGKTGTVYMVFNQKIQLITEL